MLIYKNSLFFQADTTCDNEKTEMNHSTTVEGCGNVSSKTPQLGESPLSNDELINSPLSPDYPPPVSMGPTSPDTTYATSVASARTTTNSATDESEKCSGKVVKQESDKNSEAVIKMESELELKNETSNKCNDVKYSERESSEVQVKHEPPDKVDVKFQTDWSSAKSVVDSTISSCQATANSTVNASHGKSHSSSSSSSRDKKSSSRDQSDKRHCSRCYRRSKIKRASIGVQCKRDRRNSSSINVKSSSQAISLGDPCSDNMRLNLQTKTCKVLGKHNKFSCLEGLKYKRFINIETYPNGGATVVHMYQDEIDTLTKEQVEELAQEFFKVSSSFANQTKRFIYLNII